MLKLGNCLEMYTCAQASAQACKQLQCTRSVQAGTHAMHKLGTGLGTCVHFQAVSKLRHSNFYSSVLTLCSCKSSVWKWGSRTATASRSISDKVARHTPTTGITRWQNLSIESMSFISDKFNYSMCTWSACVHGLCSRYVHVTLWLYSKTVPGNF